MSSPFHRLLTFFAARSPYPNTQTVTFLDSLRGDLSIGFNFPVALFLAVTRHLVFGNTGPLSLYIHVPSVKTSRVLLGGEDKFTIDEKKRYGLRELASITSSGTLSERLEAVGCWGLVARTDGTIQGREIRAYQRGEIMEIVAERRKSRQDVLPFWRGGPISVAGHSWAVSKAFGVDVYQKDLRIE